MRSILTPRSSPNQVQESIIAVLSAAYNRDAADIRRALLAYHPAVVARRQHERAQRLEAKARREEAEILRLQAEPDPPHDPNEQAERLAKFRSASCLIRRHANTSRTLIATPV